MSASPHLPVTVKMTLLAIPVATMTLGAATDHRAQDQQSGSDATTQNSSNLLPAPKLCCLDIVGGEFLLFLQGLEKKKPYMLEKTLLPKSLILWNK